MLSAQFRSTASQLSSLRPTTAPDSEETQHWEARQAESVVSTASPAPRPPGPATPRGGSVPFRSSTPEGSSLKRKQPLLAKQIERAERVKSLLDPEIRHFRMQIDEESRNIERLRAEHERLLRRRAKVLGEKLVAEQMQELLNRSGITNKTPEELEDKRIVSGECHVGYDADSWFSFISYGLGRIKTAASSGDFEAKIAEKCEEIENAEERLREAEESKSYWDEKVAEQEKEIAALKAQLGTMNTEEGENARKRQRLS